MPIADQEELKEREKVKEEKIRKAKEAGQELTEEELAEDDKKERIVPDARVPEPVRIAFPPPPTEDEPTPELPSYKEGFSNTKIVGISSGSRYNLAWDESGILYSWGEGVSNQLGLGPKTEEAHVPTRVHNTALKTWKVVGASAGGQHVMLLYVLFFIYIQRFLLMIIVVADFVQWCSERRTFGINAPRPSALSIILSHTDLLHRAILSVPMSLTSVHHRYLLYTSRPAQKPFTLSRPPTSSPHLTRPLVP